MDPELNIFVQSDFFNLKMSVWHFLKKDFYNVLIIKTVDYFFVDLIEASFISISLCTEKLNY